MRLGRDEADHQAAREGLDVVGHHVLHRFASMGNLRDTVKTSSIRMPKSAAGFHAAAQVNRTHLGDLAMTRYFALLLPLVVCLCASCRGPSTPEEKAVQAIEALGGRAWATEQRPTAIATTISSILMDTPPWGGT